MKFTAFFSLIFTTLLSSAQLNIQQLGHYPYPNNVSASNLTGYADTSGREYALVGTSQGLSIVDITNPSTPIQLFLVPGATGQGGFWREVREYKGYAYVTTEQSSGLVVVNLNYLPDSIKYHTINPNSMQTSHSIFIDENGIAYINGTNKDQQFLDLNADPWNPPYIGKYSNRYVHDCFVRNDTMWAANINDGVVTVVDVSTKTGTSANAPAKTLATFSTPLNFSHNTWLSDDSRYLFTTDEKPSSFLTCYDVSNLNNITETDRTQVNPGSNTIIHNTYFMNDYCITSYYTYGITIHDVTRKNNLIEVGNFDSSPAYSGDGFNGAWGVWPYLPSGNIIISDIETGLWIVKPTYKRAAYLEGVVKDSACNSLLNGVKIEILNTTVKDFTNVLGKYATGSPDSGMYSIRFTKAGYQPYQKDSVILDNGYLTTINVNMVPISTSSMVIRTVDSLTGTALPFTRVLIRDGSGTTYQEVATNTNAEYAICDFVQGNYEFYAGRWGRNTAYVSKNINSVSDTITIPVSVGYYDDFIMDYGWTVSSTATSGAWERENPVGTTYQGAEANPENDVASDYGQECYVTGNNGGAAGDDDIDNGYTILRSPLFDLTTYDDPWIDFDAWFFNDGGQGTPPNDSLIVYLSNGFDTVQIAMMDYDSVQSSWKHFHLHVTDFVFKAINMRIFFIANDATPGHLVEAAVDRFLVVDSPVIQSGIGQEYADVQMRAYPNPFNETLSVYVDRHSSATELELQNAVGQVIVSQRVTEDLTVVNLTENVSSGIYFLKLKENGSTIRTLKLLRYE